MDVIRVGLEAYIEERMQLSKRSGNPSVRPTARRNNLDAAAALRLDATAQMNDITAANGRCCVIYSHVKL